MVCKFLLTSVLIVVLKLKVRKELRSLLAAVINTDLVLTVEVVII